MKLTEFDLDLPKADPDERRDFRWQIRCVGDLYARCFSSFGPTRARKVLVQCVPVVSRLEVVDQLGVLCQEASFELKKFQAADAYRRKVMALEVLQRGVLAVAKAEHWPLPPFEAARQGVIEKNYVNQWTWPKPVASANKQWRAHLSCSHDTDAFTAWLVVLSKDGEVVAKKQAFTEAPNEFIFVPFLGSVKWTGERKVTLLAKNGKKVADLTVPADSSSR